MRGKLIKVLTGMIAVILLLALVTGCGGDEETPEAPGEPEYAGAATEVILQGLSEKDLEKYTRYGNPDFKAAVTQEILDNAAALIEDQYGAYKSIEFLSVEEQEGYTHVHYKATYENGKIGVRMVFDSEHMVAGQWFE
ncbi:MAG: DUF3887 domain-containing protein [Dehalococcoidales bacterium]|nr:DUF3887 domain-containing protein [Dehalococcoidales bacterium]